MGINVSRSGVSVGTSVITAGPNGPGGNPPILGDGPWSDRAHADHPVTRRGKFRITHCPQALFLAPVLVDDGEHTFPVGGLDEARTLYDALGAFITSVEVAAERSRPARAEVRP